MSSLGRYLELSVYTPDIIESLGFYKLLGFSELEIGDVLPGVVRVVPCTTRKFSFVVSSS